MADVIGVAGEVAIRLERKGIVVVVFAVAFGVLGAIVVAAAVGIGVVLVL